MKTVFVALVQIPYEGEKFMGVYTSRNNAEKALLKVWEEDSSLSRREAGLVVSEILVNGDKEENVVNFWKVKPPEKQWKEW